MSINPFTWIANRVRAAVHAGFADGLNDIGAFNDVPAAGSPLAMLQEKMRALPALPSATITDEDIEDEPASVNGKKGRGK